MHSHTCMQFKYITEIQFGPACDIHPVVVCAWHTARSFFCLPFSLCVSSVMKIYPNVSTESTRWTKIISWFSHSFLRYTIDFNSIYSLKLLLFFSWIYCVFSSICPDVNCIYYDLNLNENTLKWSPWSE